MPSVQPHLGPIQQWPLAIVLALLSLGVTVAALSVPVVKPTLPSTMLALLLVALTWTDLLSRRLPDALTMLLLACGFLNAFTAGAGLLWAALSAAVGFISFVAIARTYFAVRRRPGLGLG